MKPFSAVILAALAVISGCTLNLAPPGAQIQISVANTARALTVDSITWELSGEGPEGSVLDAVALSVGSNTIEDLAIGTWTLKLNGKDEAGDTVSQGGAVVDLQPGPNEVTMSMVGLGLVAKTADAPNDGVLIISGQVYTTSTKDIQASAPGSTLSEGLIKSPPNGGYVVVFSAYSSPGLTYAWVLDGNVLVGETGSTLEKVVTSMTATTVHHLNLVVTDSSGNVFSQEIAIHIGSPS